MSMGVEYSVEPSSTSGGRYHSVTTSFEYVLVGTDLARARPKSASCGGEIDFIAIYTVLDSPLYVVLGRRHNVIKESLITFTLSRTFVVAIASGANYQVRFKSDKDYTDFFPR